MIRQRESIRIDFPITSLNIWTSWVTVQLQNWEIMRETSFLCQRISVLIQQLNAILISESFLIPTKQQGFLYFILCFYASRPTVARGTMFLASLSLWLSDLVDTMSWELRQRRMLHILGSSWNRAFAYRSLSRSWTSTMLSLHYFAINHIMYAINSRIHFSAPSSPISSWFVCHLISFITTLTIHHSVTLSLQIQDIPLSQILPPP